MRARLSALLLQRGWLVALLAAVLYVWLAPSRIVDGDNAEFVTLSQLGGAAHPSGYPGYVLWLRLWSWLPLRSPAEAAAVATIVFSVAQLVVLHAAARAWGMRPLAASLAVALFMAAPAVLAMDTEAEVFAPNGLVVALVLWLAAAAGPLRGVRRAAALGLVAGLGMTNQLTCVLVAPVGLLGVVRGVREAGGARAVAAAVGGLVLGWTPYLYLVVAPEHQGTWSASRSAGSILERFLREDYGGPGTFGPQGVAPEPLAQLRVLVASLGRAYAYVPALAAVIVLVGLALRRQRPANESRLAPTVERPGAEPGPREPRAGWITLLACLLISGPLMVVKFNYPPRGIGMYIVERFHLLPIEQLVIPVAATFELVLARLPPVRRALATLATVACVLVAVGASLPHQLRAHAPAVAYETEWLVQQLPPDAVVIGSSDELYNGFNYEQLIEHRRADVVFVQWPMMGIDWYRERLGARLVRLPLEGSEPASVRLARLVLATGRPLFVDTRQTIVLHNFPAYPFAALMRVMPVGSPLPDALEVYAMNRAAFARLRTPYPAPGREDGWPAEVHRKYAETWDLIARELARRGHPTEAQAATALADAYTPE